MGIVLAKFGQLCSKHLQLHPPHLHAASLKHQDTLQAPVFMQEQHAELPVPVWEMKPKGCEMKTAVSV